MPTHISPPPAYGVTNPSREVAMDSQTLAEQLSAELNRTVILADQHRHIIGTAHASDDSTSSDSGLDLPTGESTLLPFAGDDDRWAELRLNAYGIPAGYARIRVDSAPLTAREHALIDLAATLIAAADATLDGRTDIRELNAQLLLAADPADRRAALHRARARRWLPTGGVITVHALLFDDHTAMLERRLTIHRISRHLHAHADVLRQRGNMLFLLSTTPFEDEDIDEALRDNACRNNLPVAGIGSAIVRGDDEDLARAAHAAASAAEINVAVPELVGHTRADRLGGWALLHAINAQRDLLDVASPAAAALCGLGDTHRETVEVYLDNAGGVRETCDRLHIHRTTLYYRLDNLPEVVKDALADGMQRSTLHLALKLDKLWTPATPSPQIR